jgi:hypothetical protein
MVTEAGRIIQAARQTWAARALEFLDAFERGGNAAVIELAKKVTETN